MTHEVDLNCFASLVCGAWSARSLNTWLSTPKTLFFRFFLFTVNSSSAAEVDTFVNLNKKSSKTPFNSDFAKQPQMCQSQQRGEDKRWISEVIFIQYKIRRKCEIIFPHLHQKIRLGELPRGCSTPAIYIVCCRKDIHTAYKVWA